MLPLRARVSAALLLALAALAAGCGHHAGAPPPKVAPPPAEQPTTPPPTVARAGYDGDSGYRPEVDASALRGRRILLDPGHGGRWAGSRGTEGMREADVNLRVALALAPLLRGAGAQVVLTRESDTTLAVPPDTSLATDLRMRARMADSLAVDVFLSLHHNADAGGRHDVNETQTYYRTGDDGPSLDLAQRIHRRLVLGLRAGSDRLLPGNYAVLRQTHVTCAVLGEASYLTYPPTEKRLADSSATRLEAECYFMGLLDYFKDGVPRVRDIAWDPVWNGPAAERPLVAHGTGTVDGLRWMVDGDTVAAARVNVATDQEGGFEMRYAPAAPWTDGAHIAWLQVRNMSGNHSAPRLDTLDVGMPAVRLEAHAWPESSTAGPIALTVRGLDAWNRPVADTLSVADVHWDSGYSGLPWLRDRAVGEPGEARFYLAPVEKRGRLTLNARWKTLRTTVTLPANASAWRSGFVRRADTGAGLPGAQVSIDGGSAAATNSDGFFALPGARSAALRVSAAGFLDTGKTDHGDPLVSPVVGGALLGRRIALDPEGGGDESGGAGPSGVRGASINLAVARILKEDLERAGAAVILTRESDASVSSLARVQASERFRADRLVRIARRLGGPTSVGYFPSSAGGRALASRVHKRVWENEAYLPQRVDSTDTRKPPVLMDDASYVLQQTSVPSISVRSGDLARPADEQRFLDPGWRHREAYALYLALAEEFGARADSLTWVRISVWSGINGVAGATVRLDGVPLLTDSLRAEARFGLLDPRIPHRLEVSWGDKGPVRSAWIDLTREHDLYWNVADASPKPSVHVNQP
jgi:N-acetylmuramoyl-L-alanine amidase